MESVIASILFGTIGGRLCTLFLLFGTNELCIAHHSLWNKWTLLFGTNGLCVPLPFSLELTITINILLFLKVRDFRILCGKIS
jgi:hypothetical protein